ncbi:UMP kinase [Candidatus Purcelliella pentastirinorum]|uniref:Uridylate kinase n=1 Tax=Candidatus Purcelliella pentastirinorum TaxID=472834 RepID=A0AAX3N872_9ENTR|nr:UMP kinase [Candidatus Purcelliella pentastirinorum]WDI78641.1 UMP kinase [Candidatus Purcelliella pentastirinorum]
MLINTDKFKYRRILLKVSGEIFGKNDGSNININIINNFLKEIKSISRLGIQIGLVIGGGNIVRGSDISHFGIDRVICDYMGMLSTIINGLALSNILHNSSVNSYLMSSIPIDGICHTYDYLKAIDLLIKNFVVIFVGGIGNPFFTTDSAACLRGIELNADIILKGTKVDGVFSADPSVYPNAILYDKLSYSEILNLNLKIMDSTAFIMAKEHKLPIRIFNINSKGIIKRIIMGEDVGTLIY